MNAEKFLHDNRHTLRNIFLCAAVYLPDTSLGFTDSRPFVRDMIYCLSIPPYYRPEVAAYHVYKGLVRIEWACIHASVWREYRKQMPMLDISDMKDQMEAHGFNSLR